MNTTRSLKVSTMIVAVLAAALGACTAATDGQGEHVGVGKQALCPVDGCDPAGDPPPPPAPRPRAPVSHTHGTCPSVSSSCGGSGTYPLANDSSEASWTAFQNQLSALGCPDYSLEMPVSSMLWHHRFTLCRTSTALTDLVAATTGSALDSTYCDACLGAPNAGYTWVEWDFGGGGGHCPGGCSQPGLPPGY